jgi:hypothetical protein
MKIVINTRYGGFGLSQEAIDLYAKKSGILLIESDEEYIFNEKIYENYSPYDLDRTNPFLIETVEELGDEANGWLSELKVVEIPDDVEYTIEEYDGAEWIAEKHRTWR